MEKLKKGIISSLAKVLATVDTSKMTSESRVAIVRNFIATKLVANEIATLEEETGKKLVTDEFKDLQAKETKTEKCTTYTPTTDTSYRCLICGELKYEHNNQ